MTVVVKVSAVIIARLYLHLLQQNNGFEQKLSETLMSFSNWLQNAGLNGDTIHSLQTSNYNSMYVICASICVTSCNIHREALKRCHNDDINSIAVALNIQTLQKLKLKSALRQYHENESDKHVNILFFSYVVFILDEEFVS